jgi:HEAT repeat protein
VGELLGQSHRLPALLELLHGEDSPRHAAVNVLADIVRPEDVPEFTAALKALIERETNPGLKADAARVLEKLEAGAGGGVLDAAMQLNFLRCG